MFHEDSFLRFGRGFLVEKRVKRILEREDHREKQRLQAFLPAVYNKRDLFMRIRRDFFRKDGKRSSAMVFGK